MQLNGPGALTIDWSVQDGRRVLEPHPSHEAPEGDCACGVYSWAARGLGGRARLASIPIDVVEVVAIGQLPQLVVVDRPRCRTR